MHADSFIAEEWFAAGGCSWKGLSTEQQQQVYYFHGSCKTKRGLSSVLTFYDRHGMIRIAALRAEGMARGVSSSDALQRVTGELKELASKTKSLRSFLLLAAG